MSDAVADVIEQVIGAGRIVSGLMEDITEFVKEQVSLYVGLDELLKDFEGKPVDMAEAMSALLKVPAVHAAALKSADHDLDLQALLKQAVKGVAGCDLSAFLLILLYKAAAAGNQDAALKVAKHLAVAAAARKAARANPAAAAAVLVEHVMTLSDDMKAMADKGTQAGLEALFSKFEGKPEAKAEAMSALLKVSAVHDAVNAAALKSADHDLQALLKQAVKEVAGGDLSASLKDDKLQAAVINAAKENPVAAAAALQGLLGADLFRYWKHMQYYFKYLPSCRAAPEDLLHFKSWQLGPELSEFADHLLEKLMN
jgi:hypothetical protein